MDLTIFVAACISGHIFYTQVTLHFVVDKVFDHLISNILSNNNDIINNIFVIITLIIKITISWLVIGLKKLQFSTNLLAKLLSDSSMSQSHSKL